MPQKKKKSIQKKVGRKLKQPSRFGVSILNNNEDKNLLKKNLAVKNTSLRGHLQNHSQLIWKSAGREKF